MAHGFRGWADFKEPMHDGVRFVSADDYGPFKFCDDCGEMWRGSAWTLCAIARTHGHESYTWPPLTLVADQDGAEAAYRLGGILGLAEFVLDGPQGSPERHRDGWPGCTTPRPRFRPS